MPCSPSSFLRRHLDALQADPALQGALHPAEERDGRWYADAPALGLAFMTDADQVVTTVFIYCSPLEGFAVFADRLPYGLTTAMSRDQVRSVLGAPERAGEPRNLPVLGAMPAWDRFVVDEGRLHVSYQLASAGISMLTLMTSESAP